MKKNYLPILLLVGAGIAAFMLLRKRKEDETLLADEDQEPTVTKPETSAVSTAITKGLTKALEKIKQGAQAKKEGGAVKTIVASAVKARKEAIERAKKAGVPKKTAAAIVESIKKGIRIKGFDDNNVLV